MLLDIVTLKLYGIISFINNGAISGDELLKSLSKDWLISYPDVVNFYTNITATYEREELLVDISDLSFVGRINFCENAAQSLQGGAILSVDSSVTISGNATLHFENNTAFHGGAILKWYFKTNTVTRYKHLFLSESYKWHRRYTLYQRFSVFIWINPSYRMLSFHL